MKALLSRLPGGPDTLVLEEIPEPLPEAGQVRIAVRACGVNYPDLLIIQDLYQIKPTRPFAPGAEVAGVVDALGDGVSNVAVGERVLLAPVRSGMAQKAVGLASSCWQIPDSMPFEEAAALLMTYGTSQHALKDRAQLRPGETLLVSGATGNFGSATVALALAMGARCVVAPGRNTAVLDDLRRRFGQRVVPVRLSGDGAADTDTMKRAAAGPIDAVQDFLPPSVGAGVARAAIMTLRQGGRAVLMGGVGMLGGEDLALPYPWIMRNLITVRGQWMYDTAAIPGLVSLVRSGLLDLGHWATTAFPLTGANDAVAHAAANAGPFKLTVLQP